MVLKTKRRGIVTGSTIKSYPFRGASKLKEKNYSRPIEGSFYVRETDLPVEHENITIADMKVDKTVMYSLGKKSRWLLQSYLKETAENFYENPKRIILTERLMLTNERMRYNCISYYDSMHPNAELNLNVCDRPGMVNLSSYALQSEPWYNREYSNRARRKRRRCTRGGRRLRQNNPVETIPERPSGLETTEVEFLEPASRKSPLYYTAAYNYDLRPSPIPERSIVRRKFKKRVELRDDILQEISEDSSCCLETTKDEMNEIVSGGDDCLFRNERKFTLDEFIINKPINRTKKKRRKSARHETFNEVEKKRKIIYEEGSSSSTIISSNTMSDDEEVDHVVDLSCRPLPVTTCSVYRDDVRQEDLFRLFENDYKEGESIPRNFMIDISRRLQLTAPSVIVIFEEVGHVNDLIEMRIKLNSMCPTRLEEEFAGMLLTCHSIEEIINEIISQAENFPLKSFDERTIKSLSCEFQYDEEMTPSYRPSSSTQTLRNVFRVHPEWNRQSITLARHRPTIHEKYEVICQVCFDVGDGVQDFTCLSQCKHLFCNECWMQHLLLAVRTGKRKIKCPQYECESVVDLVTILSFLPLDIYKSRLVILESEVVTWKMIESSSVCRRCGLLLIIEQSTPVRNIPLYCECGHSQCALCRSDSHWPASCKNTNYFNKKLKTLGDDKLTPPSATISSVTVKGKKCPKCDRFIEKNGGCNHMSCLCGFNFCWRCEETWANRHYNCSMMTERKEYVFEGNNVPSPGSLRSRRYCKCIEARLESHSISLMKVWNSMKRLEDMVAGNFKLNACDREVQSIKENYELILKTREFLLVESLNASHEMQTYLRITVNALQLNIGIINNKVFQSRRKLTNKESLSIVSDISSCINYARHHIRNLAKSLYRIDQKSIF